MIQLIKMAFRDLGRNRRRSFFSALAVGLGLALLLLMASFVKGEMNGAMDSTIRLQSGHLQIRAQTYDENKASLKWEDLVENPAQIVSDIATLAPVRVATPRLYASGIASAGEQAVGVRIFGIDPASPANAPYREGLLNGEFLAPDDREGLLIGQPLAEKLSLKTGDSLNLSVNTSSGDIAQQVFTVRGIYSTQTNGFDSGTIFLPLAKAQAITQTENHASTIFVLLKDRSETDSVAAALKTSSYQVLTWTKMNEIIIQTEDLANGYMYLFYLIVLGITATVIVNTLIMAVFERTREIGILTALGMKSRSIMLMFLTESTLLALGGVIIGVVLGSLVVAIFAYNGFNISQVGYSSTSMLMTNTIFPQQTAQDTINLTITAFIITLLAGLYPAIMAARLEPVQAFRGGK